MGIVKGCDLPLRATQCETCPYREGSPYAHFQKSLVPGVLTDNTTICHSTGSNNAVKYRTGKKPHLCRGARDLQLIHMFALHVIEAPTDEAWNEQRIAIGMKPTVVKDPE